MIKPNYPDLPVVRKRADFLSLLEKHQVIIVRADTGSGKSTQLPKFLLEAGLAKHGQIGVTQPRRIAALSIADRLREELENKDLVSSRIRFWEEGAADAPLKIMTDGILLQEFRRDRYLRNYSAIMIDEAHERSLNIDILLGILHGIVHKRPEFRVIISSATLDANLFAKFFPNSATLEAEGRTYPVTVEHWTPAEHDLEAKGDSGLLNEAEAAIMALLTEKPDNLLCFLPSERDIHELNALLSENIDPRRYEILPLFGRLSPQEQKRVFRNTGAVKIVLATNIAETSLTIPGIAYVVDTGLARISRYNAQTRIQGLLVEKISQASAQQRMGRAGRVKPGRCIRLYSEDDLKNRPAYTDPEIRRSNLANVILQLKSLRLNLNDFPFIQAPARGAFRGACRQLHELGALHSPDINSQVRQIGLEMARLPMDVALSAVLLKAKRQGVLHSALIITSALCIQDPRIFPQENPEKDKARQIHNRWQKNNSDFLALLQLWNFVHENWKGGSANLRRLCNKNWLHFMRMREWMDLYEQFGRILRVKFQQLQCPLDSFHHDILHTALLSGFLGGIAQYQPEKNAYQLVGGRETHIFPGSSLARKKPEWLMAAEVRETSRVFLVRAAEIKPQWILQVAEKFCQRRWYNPEWNPRRGFVEVLEEVQFRNLVISRGKKVDYARIDIDDCADIFWREAIVERNSLQKFKFSQQNHKLWHYLQAQETRQRTWGIAPDEDQLVEWYRQQAPQVHSIRSLRKHIEKHGEASLVQKAQDWKHLAENVAKNLPTHKGSFKLGEVWKKDLAPAHSPAASKAFQQGIEHFVILGQKVRGKLIFDNSNPLDGLSLYIPASLWVRLSPATLALQVRPWRQWILESTLKTLPANAKQIIVNQGEFLDERWVERMESDRSLAPLHALLLELRSLSDLDIYAIQDSENISHLQLHLHLLEARDDFMINVSPQSTLAAYFLASYKQKELQRFWNLNNDLCWGLKYSWQKQGKVWELQSKEDFQDYSWAQH